MDGSELAVKTSNLSEKQVLSHGCSQRSPTRHERPVFVPKLPPRPRQRGALPPPASSPQHAVASMQSLAQHVSLSQFNAPLRPFKASSSQQEASLNALIPPMEEQARRQQPPDSFLTSARETCKGQLSTQPRMRGSSKKRKKKPAAGKLPNAEKFSRSWHRVSAHQEPSHQRGILPSTQEQNYRHQQRGDIRPPFQEQALQAPSAHTSSSPGFPFTPPLVAMEHEAFSLLPQMKSYFLGMWLQLEGVIQSCERMLLGMKAEMEKALSQVKVLKDDALKENAETEARMARVTENMEIMSKKTGKIRSVRQGLEQISTDLSVQVAELNHLLQQVQEQQRVVKRLESLKDHQDASIDKNSFVMKNLQDIEIKLATMERELADSKRASEVFEKAALKQIGDLEEIEAGCGLPIDLANNASSNPAVVSSMNQMSKDVTEIVRKTKMDERASGLNGEQGTLGNTAALKQPKLEVMS